MARVPTIAIMKSVSRLLKFCVLLFLLESLGCVFAADKSGGGVRITELTNRLKIELNGELFTEYYFAGVPRPFLYPLLGPGGLPMTRDYPMKEPAGEEHDHPHHRSVWFAHGDVNGIDFWTERQNCGKTLHVAFDEVKSGDDIGTIKSRNNWVGPDGKIVCTDSRTIRIYNPGSKKERVFDFEITLHASNGDLVFGDTKEGTMAVRVNETMKLKAKSGPGGHIVQNTGVRDDATWGKKAEWCDYYGPVEGKTVGIAMFDNPQNPRHPTWWHVRDYGLFAANPFGRHDFEKLTDKTAGNLKVPSGSDVTFRYRFYVHEGDEKNAKVAARYSDYVKQATGGK
jgi:hypothetical protein